MNRKDLQEFAKQTAAAAVALEALKAAVAATEDDDDEAVEVLEVEVADKSTNTELSDTLPSPNANEVEGLIARLSRAVETCGQLMTLNRDLLDELNSKDLKLNILRAEHAKQRTDWVAAVRSRDQKVAALNTAVRNKEREKVVALANELRALDKKIFFSISEEMKNNKRLWSSLE